MTEIVTKIDLGNTIKLNALAPNKFDVFIDNVTVKQASGQIYVDVANVLTSAISSDTGNDLSLGTDGKLFLHKEIKSIKVDGVTVVPDVFGAVNLTDTDVDNIIDSSTIDLQLIGTQLTAVVKVSANPNNSIQTLADGLFVDLSPIKIYLPLPQPKVHVSKITTDGTMIPQLLKTFNGVDIESYGNVEIRLQDIPSVLFKPEYNLRVELLRWTSRRNSRDNSGVTPIRRKRGSGFVHPISVDGSGNYNGVDVSGDKTRYGRLQNPIPSGYDRTTQISLIGKENGNKILLDGRYFCSFFHSKKIVDSSGKYTRVITGKHKRSDTARRNSNNSRFGYFAFRFTYKLDGEFISSPMSDVFKYGSVDCLYKTLAWSVDNELWKMNLVDKTTPIERMSFYTHRKSEFDRG